MKPISTHYKDVAILFYCDNFSKENGKISEMILLVINRGILVP